METKIIVISDTHIPIVADKLPNVLEEEIKTSNLCIHAGDLVSYQFYDKLCKLNKTVAVAGNMDDSEIIRKLPLKQVIKIGNFCIGIIHGKGSPNNLLEYIKNEFVQEFNTINIFIFGHSHIPFDKEIDGKIYFNPGSPTDKIYSPYNSYGVLLIKENTVERKIIKLKEEKI